AYVSQLKKGHDYSQLKKVYFIGLLNFEMFDNLNFISRHLIINQETTQQDIDDFEFTFIELPKFTKDLNELATTLDKWIYFIQHASDLTMIPEQYEHIKAFEDAFTIATQTQWNEDELRLYDYMGLKAYDEINAVKTAVKKAVKKAEEKAEEKGLKKGIKKGTEKEKIDIALNLIKQEVSIDIIKLSTGLTDIELGNLTKQARL
nr:Rpn family recombination-promoting nuclease/putative transposase [Colwellia sp.]